MGPNCDLANTMTNHTNKKMLGFFFVSHNYSALQRSVETCSKDSNRVVEKNMFVVIDWSGQAGTYFIA